MEALRYDGSYTSLDLSRTGVTDSGCAVLFDCLKVWGEGVRAGREGGGGREGLRGRGGKGVEGGWRGAREGGGKCGGAPLA